jgi:radical SAM enzyme (TIGR01210 family)
VSAAFPAARAERERFIASRRPEKNRLDPLRPYGYFVEEEPASPGVPLPVATIFLTNRECTFRCTMCDLWRNTLDAPAPRGAIPAQIRYALERLPDARRVKLYNAGSFFDRAAIPTEDHAAIAGLVRGFERVVVECHPALAGDDVLRFRDLLGGPDLEVAVGLETADEGALEKINKGMTVAEFETCVRRLVAHGIPVRSFVLVGVPFLRKQEWAAATRKSIDVSFGAGAQIVSLIPTRLGNGTLEELQAAGDFVPPGLIDLEAAFGDFLESEEKEGDGRAREARARRRRMVFADLWDADQLAASRCCAATRVERLRKMNILQRNLPLSSLLPCPSCGFPT